MKLVLLTTGEEFPCITLNISIGGLQVSFTDVSSLKLNDICRVLVAPQDFEFERSDPDNTLGIDYYSSSDKLVLVEIEEEKLNEIQDEPGLIALDATLDKGKTDYSSLGWEELTTLAAVTWVDGKKAGLTFEEEYTALAKMPDWFRKALLSA